jgi:hypothetical protein
MDEVTVIRVVAGLVFIAMFLVVGIFFLLTLSRALRKCSPSSRTMEPGMVWLCLVPVLNLVWPFFVVLALSNSLGNEFRVRGIINAEREPGKGIGIAMCVCGAWAIVPVVNLLALPAHLVLLIIYWVKIAGSSRLLDEPFGANIVPSAV